MKRKITGFIGAMLIGMGMQAQNWVNDTISMGTSSINDVYYSLANGTVRTEGNKNWHLGFSLSIADSAAIWANHNASNSFVKVYNIHKDSSQWSTVTLNDTLTASLCYNNDKGWYQGALNDVYSTDIFNYGWGTYDQSTHKILGDSIFIVKANGVFYKVFINELDAVTMNWAISVGDIVANTSYTDTIKKQVGFTNRLFAYYDLAAQKDTNREPEIATWDILFTRYTTDDPTSGQNPHNSVLGVLANTNGSSGVRVARAYMILEDDALADYNTYLASLSPVISSVGFNWKTFDLASFTYFVEDSNSYFIKDRNGIYYQLQFTGFSGINGPGSGTTSFRKRLLAPVNVHNVNSLVAAYSVSPVPASNYIDIMMDSKAAGAVTISLLDMQGRIVRTASISLKQGVNGYTLPVSELPNGNYLINIQGKQVKLTQKVSIAH